jgi:dihydrofolate reductase
MSKIIINCAITVDGLIEAPVPAPQGWLIMEGDHEPAMFGLFETAAGMLLGRKNYQGFAAVWPPMAGDGRWADRLNPMPKWVASTTLSNPLEWNATVIEGDVAAEIRRLKAELDGDLITSGGGAFARFLVEQGLVDEVLFWVNPIIQGPGERPFPAGGPIDLELLGSRSFDSGVTLLHYRPHVTRRNP